jgi:beta-glucanase (GH16 family)
MTLIWSDEFDAGSLDAAKWTHEQGDGCPNVCGWGNNELQYYQSNNTSIIEGIAMIEARVENVGGRNYTSSRIITKDKFTFKYGRVDVRAALPKGQGIWPAIWMLGKSIGAVSWPKCGEIDIMEMIGGAGREKTVHGTAHWDESGHKYDGGHYDLSAGTFADEFHVFTIIWTETAITWYVDDIQFHVIDITPATLSEFKEEYFLLMNVAVGGNWPGNPDGNTAFPQRMFVDYIRVFQQD